MAQTSQKSHNSLKPAFIRVFCSIRTKIKRHPSAGNRKIFRYFAISLNRPHTISGQEIPNLTDDGRLFAACLLDSLLISYAQYLKKGCTFVHPVCGRHSGRLRPSWFLFALLTRRPTGSSFCGHWHDLGRRASPWVKLIPFGQHVPSDPDPEFSAKN